jgi:dUTPase
MFKNLSSKLILGIYAIDNLGITYLSKTKSFMFQEALNPEKFQKADLRVISTLEIPTTTRVQVRLGKTIGNSQNPMPSGLMAVTNFASMDFPCLFAQSGLVSPDHHGQMMMIVQNCSNEDITIPRCSNIGYFENAKNPYFDNISEIKSKEWEIKVSKNPQLPEPDPLSQLQKAKFLAKAKINVPIVDKYQYKDLLCKHHDMFSKDKQDLGKGMNFEHKMFTETY